MGPTRNALEMEREKKRKENKLTGMEQPLSQPASSFVISYFVSLWYVSLFINDVFMTATYEKGSASSMVASSDVNQGLPQM